MGRRGYRGRQCGGPVDCGDVNLLGNCGGSGGGLKTYEARTTSRLLGEMDLRVGVSNSLAHQARVKFEGTYMDPTGASTFIDMSKLKVGESYAEEVFPFSNGVFRELMMVFIGGEIPGARRGIIVSQFRE